MFSELVKTYIALSAGGLACILVGWLLIKFTNFLMSTIKSKLVDITTIIGKVATSIDLHDIRSAERDMKLVRSIDNLVATTNGGNPQILSMRTEMRKIVEALNVLEKKGGK